MDNKREIYEDIWMPTQCGRCYASCGIRVRRVDGVAVKIEGEPDSTLGAGVGSVLKGVQDFRCFMIPTD